MRIKFTYQNSEITERDGTLLSIASGVTSLTSSFHYVLVAEDGVDHPKSFRFDRMFDIQTYADRDPVQDALQAAADAFAGAADKLLVLQETLREVRK